MKTTFIKEPDDGKPKVVAQCVECGKDMMNKEPCGLREVEKDVEGKNYMEIFLEPICLKCKKEINGAEDNPNTAFVQRAKREDQSENN